MARKERIGVGLDLDIDPVLAEHAAYAMHRYRMQVHAPPRLNRGEAFTDLVDQLRRLVRSTEARMEVASLLMDEGKPAQAREHVPWKGVREVVVDRETGLVEVDAGFNLVVISGRRISGRRTFLISGDTPPGDVSHMGIDNDTTNPSETTNQFNTTSANRSIKAFDSAFGTITGVGVSPVVVTTQATWDETDSPGPGTIVVRRIGLAIDATNNANTLYSILGGTATTQILELDMTGLDTFTFKPQIDVTLSNQSSQ